MMGEKEDWGKGARKLFCDLPDLERKQNIAVIQLKRLTESRRTSIRPKQRRTV